MMDQQIKEYLHFGYSLSNVDIYPFTVQEVFSGKGVSEQKPIDQLHQVFRQVIAKEKIDQNIVIPLSGGLDSRLLLAEYLNQYEHDQIKTVTFGVNYSLDTTLPLKLTNEFGLSHTFINLFDQDFSEESLVDFAQYHSNPTLLVEAYCNHLTRRSFSQKDIFVSGYFGDPVAGFISPAHQKIVSFNDALETFVNESKVDKTGFLPSLESSSLSIQDDNFSFLTPYEKVNFRLRQVNMIEPIVVDERLNYQTPFRDSDLVQLMFSLPQTARIEKKLFFEMADKYYPDYFRIGLKNFFGARIQSSQIEKSLRRKYCYAKTLLSRRFPGLQINDPLLNYFDPFWFYVSNESTSKMVQKNLADLKKRDVLDGLNPLLPYEKFSMGDYNFSNAVKLLFNIELYLKGGAFE